MTPPISPESSMDKKNVGHTKGPWKQGGRHGHNAGTIYAVDKDDAIACVYGIPMHTKVDEVEGRYAEGMANARLIASAPSLLEALEILSHREKFKDAEAMAEFAAIAFRAAKGVR